jgi:hypothetical protein
MGERKGLVTYISPDFDPSLLTKKKSKKTVNAREEIRLALPFSLQCTACHEFMYKGRKFNAKKEVVTGENYLGVKILRFYIRCGRCSSHITFKSDPKNGSYVPENGCTKNFEAWHAAKAAADAEAIIEIEDKQDAMKDLEQRTASNQAEMAALDELAAIKEKGYQNDRLVSDPDAVLRALKNRHNGLNSGVNTGGEKPPVLNSDGLTADDEELLKTIKFHKKVAASDSDTDEETRVRQPSLAVDASKLLQTSSIKNYSNQPVGFDAAGWSLMPPDAPRALIVVKQKAASVIPVDAVATASLKRKRDDSPEDAITQGPQAVVPSALGSLGAYGSDSD